MQRPSFIVHRGGIWASVQLRTLWPALLLAASTGILAADLRPQADHAQAPARTPDVPFQPTPQEVVTEMLRTARVGPKDVVYDLGCGDGRIVVGAAMLGARGVCVDIDPQRIAESRENAGRAGVTEKITFLTQDLFETDIRDATVVMLFLWPEVNLKLRPKLWRDLKPGTRVVSYVHDMGDWIPQHRIDLPNGRRLFLWLIPPAWTAARSPARLAPLRPQSIFIPDAFTTRDHFANSSRT